MNLQEFFCSHPKVALAFSGGVDSAYLLYTAKALGAEVKAYYVKSQFQPDFELADALRLAAELEAEIQVIDCDILADSVICGNPADRCYYCKNRIFSEILKAAEKDGYHVVMDGTNASDDADSRPGMRALREMKVLSPLRLCGITKSQVRALSREAGLFTWDKPSYACLATRVQTGEIITLEKLKAVEQAEDSLSELGFRDFRVRIFYGAARIQLPAEQMEKALKLRREIRDRLRPYFDNILLDLEER